MNVAGSAASAWMTRFTKCAPSSGGASGCSENAWLATTHDTCGSVPSSTSALIAAAMSSGVEPVDGHRGHAALVQRAAGGGAGELLEVGQRVVAEVVARVLVDLPGHPGVLQRLGVGLPAQARLGAAVVRRAAGGAVRVDHRRTTGRCGSGRSRTGSSSGTRRRPCTRRRARSGTGCRSGSGSPWSGWSPWPRPSCPSCRCSRPRAGCTSRGPASRRTARASSLLVPNHRCWFRQLPRVLPPGAVRLVEHRVAAGELTVARSANPRTPFRVPK